MDGVDRGGRGGRMWTDMDRGGLTGTGMDGYGGKTPVGLRPKVKG